MRVVVIPGKRTVEEKGLEGGGKGEGRKEEREKGGNVCAGVW
jgi:hypothetical protein